MELVIVRRMYRVTVITDDYQPDTWQAGTSVYASPDEVSRVAARFLERWLIQHPGRAAHYEATFASDH